MSQYLYTNMVKKKVETQPIHKYGNKIRANITHKGMTNIGHNLHTNRDEKYRTQPTHK